MNSKSTRQHDLAYVLHTRPFRNTSLIVEAFTRESGRFSLVAKGARQGRSGFYAQLQPFVRLYLGWGGRSEMPTLYSAEINAAHHTLQREALYSGLYINELLMRLLHQHDPHPALFDAYQQCLQAIQQHTTIDVSLRYFEMDLLEQLGYGVYLEVEISSAEPIVPEKMYTYVIEHGPRVQTERDADVLYVTGKTLMQLQARRLIDTETRREAKQLLRSILDHYLGFRPLKTRELVRPRVRPDTSTISGD